MVLVSLFPVHRGLDGQKLPVVGGDLVRRRGRSSVPGLEHVEIEPLPVVDIRGGGLGTRRMEGFEEFPAVPVAESPRHRVDHVEVPLFGERTVPAEDPDDIVVMTQTSGKPFSPEIGVLRVEDLRSLAPEAVELVAPGRQDPHPESAPLRFRDDELDVIEIRVLPARVRLHGIGDARLVREKRQASVGVRLRESRELREDHALNEIEALLRAAVEIAAGLLPVEPVKKLPCRVADEIDRPPLPVGQMTPVLVNPEHFSPPFFMIIPYPVLRRKSGFAAVRFFRRDAPVFAQKSTREAPKDLTAASVSATI